MRFKIVWSVCSSVNITYFRSSGRPHITWNCSRHLFTCQGWYCWRPLLTCRAWDCSRPLLTRWMWRAPHIKSDTRGKCTCILHTHFFPFFGIFFIIGRVKVWKSLPLMLQLHAVATVFLKSRLVLMWDMAFCACILSLPIIFINTGIFCWHAFSAEDLPTYRMDRPFIWEWSKCPTLQAQESALGE